MSGAASLTACCNPSLFGGGGGGEKLGGGGGGLGGGEATGGMEGGGGVSTTECSTVSTLTLLVVPAKRDRDHCQDEANVPTSAVSDAPFTAQAVILARAKPAHKKLDDGDGDSGHANKAVRTAEVDAVTCVGVGAKPCANDSEGRCQDLRALVQPVPQLRRPLLENLQLVLEHCGADTDWGEEKPREKHHTNVNDVRPKEILLDEHAFCGNLIALAVWQGGYRGGGPEGIITLVHPKPVRAAVRHDEDRLAAAHRQFPWSTRSCRALVGDVELQPQGGLAVFTHHLAWMLRPPVHLVYGIRLQLISLDLAHPILKVPNDSEIACAARGHGTIPRDSHRHPSMVTLQGHDNQDTRLVGRPQEGKLAALLQEWEGRAVRTDASVFRHGLMAPRPLPLAA
eukprot:scaffold13637_cov112-Isochrysis_galbana.AAC.11